MITQVSNLNNLSGGLLCKILLNLPVSDIILKVQFVSRKFHAIVNNSIAKNFLKNYDKLDIKTILISDINPLNIQKLIKGGIKANFLALFFLLNSDIKPPNFKLTEAPFNKLMEFNVFLYTTKTFLTSLNSKCQAFYDMNAKDVKSNYVDPLKDSLALLNERINQLEHDWSKAMHFDAVWIQSKNRQLSDVLKLLLEKKDISALFYTGIQQLSHSHSKTGNLLGIQSIVDSAEAGCAEAQFTLGKFYYDGKIVTLSKQENQALHWYEKAAMNGHPIALHNYGIMQLQSADKKYKEFAMDCLRKAADMGIIDSQYALASYLEEDGKIKEAIEWYLKTAIQGDVKSQRCLTNLYSEGTEKDDDKAYFWALELTKKGGAQELSDLGQLLCVQSRSKEAFDCFFRAACMGSLEAAYFVGMMYLHGTGIENNLVEGLYWLSKAADGDFLSAQCELGSMLYHGVEIEQNLELAFSWSLVAAQKGSVGSQIRVGVMYADGKGTERNPEEAAYWFKLAVKNEGYQNITHRSEKSADDLYVMGILHQYGIGMEKNPEIARVWFKKADESGHPIAKKHLLV